MESFHHMDMGESMDPPIAVGLSNVTQIYENRSSLGSCSLHTVIDYTRYSSLKKRIIITAYVLRFGNIL